MNLAVGDQVRVYKRTRGKVLSVGAYVQTSVGTGWYGEESLERTYPMPKFQMEDRLTDRNGNVGEVYGIQRAGLTYFYSMLDEKDGGYFGAAEDALELAESA